MSSCGNPTVARSFYDLRRWLRRAPMLLMILSLAPARALSQTTNWESYLPGSSSLPSLTGTTSTSTTSLASASTTSLAAYNVGPSTVTVAGLSSGGFMAVQLQVAYSQSIFGTAVFAGGPYYCAQGSINSALGYCESGNGIPLQTLVDYTNAQAASGKIDPTSHIANKPIYMFSGTNDTTVHQAVMNTLQQYYETLLSG
jgi:predicted esterase